MEPADGPPPKNAIRGGGLGEVGPLFAWVAILVIVGLFMQRRYLRPARAAWEAVRPPLP